MNSNTRKRSSTRSRRRRILMREIADRVETHPSSSDSSDSDLDFLHRVTNQWMLGWIHGDPNTFWKKIS